MVPIGRAIEHVIRAGVAPLLTAAGFQRQARVFRRPRGEGIDVVSVQGSKWNAGSSGEFTVNLGVYFPAVAALIVPGERTDPPGNGSCQVRRRLEVLVPVNRHQWWPIGPRTDLDRLAQAVQTALSTNGLPWFDTVPNLAAALPLLEEKASFYYAAAAALSLGDRAAAERYLARLIDRFPERSEYRTWGEQHGLLPA